MQASSVLDALAQAAIFRGLPREALVRLLEVGHQRRFGAGSVLLRQGDPSDLLHVILRGRVRVEYAAPGHPTPLFLRELGPGEVVGEMGLLDNAPRSATVTAIDPVTTPELGFPAMAVTAVQHPHVAAALLRTLSQRLRNATALAARGRAGGRTASDEEREQAARLEGARLVARTLQHYLNNQLALTVGFCELVARDPRLPSDLQELVNQARSGAHAAAYMVQRFQRLTRISELASPGLPTLLDLEGAFEPDQPAGDRAAQE